MVTSLGLLGLILLMSIAPCSRAEAAPDAGSRQQPGNIQPARPQTPAAEEDKRAWQDLNGGWGKRGWQDLQAGWGKRAWQDLNSGWGKRAWQDLGSAWGKRAWRDLGSAWGKRAWQDLNGGWGKRGWQDLQSGWGKRAWQDLQPGWGKRAWDDLRPMWGKRYYTGDESEEVEDGDIFPAAEDADNVDDESVGSDEKRAWRSLSGAWGKRAGDWANFRGLIGMKEEPGASSNEE